VLFTPSVLCMRFLETFIKTCFRTLVFHFKPIYEEKTLIVQQPTHLGKFILGIAQNEAPLGQMVSYSIYTFGSVRQRLGEGRREREG